MRCAWHRVLATWGVVAMAAACGQAAPGTGANVSNKESPGAHAPAAAGRNPVPTPTHLPFLVQIKANGEARDLELNGVPVGAVCTAQLVYVIGATPGAASAARTQTAAYPPLTAPAVRPDRPGARTGTASFTLPHSEDPPSGPFTWNYDCKVYDQAQTHFVVFEASGHFP